jgi:hypothetical protein
MATLIPSRAPNLPIATVDYEARYQDQFANILRLYFNTIDNAIGEIIRILNYTGPFDTVYANTVEATNVNATNVNTTNLTALFAAIQQLQANTVTAANFQGGNGAFNNLTGSNVNASLFTGAGYQLNFPHIAASDSTDQVAGGNNTPTVVEWNTLDSGLGWTLNPPGSATADRAGIYKITYSLQFANTANAIHNAVVWIKKNGADVANSATDFSIPARKSALVPSYVCGYSEAVFEVNAGDEIELYWATDLAGDPTVPTDGVYIFHDPAQVAPYARPAIPSAIGSIVYLSAPPDPKTQIVPIGVSGYGRVGTPTIVMT